MNKKKITIELTNAQYQNLVTIVALGDFILQGDKAKTSTSIAQVLHQIYQHAGLFECMEIVSNQILSTRFEISTEFFEKLLFSHFKIVQKGRSRECYMLKTEKGK
jgi:hypothetical protein